jgi:hypothetical protein
MPIPLCTATGKTCCSKLLKWASITLSGIWMVSNSNPWSSAAFSIAR